MAAAASAESSPPAPGSLVRTADDKKPKGHRWYLGGIASSMGTLCTHPLDLLKVHLQTQKGQGLTMLGMARNVREHHGLSKLYQGLSASVMRQLTYSTVRFGVYDSGKAYLTDNGTKPLPVYQKLFLSFWGGLAGGLVGNPSDIVNVRMQNDLKLPPNLRYNYRHAFHGYYRLATVEGFAGFGRGLNMNLSRAVMMTTGQLAVYDQAKTMLIGSGLFADNILTHFAASTMAGAAATLLTMPVDVVKTRIMKAVEGEECSAVNMLRQTYQQEGVLAFFKGMTPAFVRLAPQTILTFLFLEQLRLVFPVR
ncbi:mitochondrial dicarboxylate carrier-like [Sycon ciliatum]|uniref:mitochondrial dicarboxylate carrier-like n=1 Tax=Sycon ciliatum TaxID=27933 RepID=UPI0020A85124|eukprot:scpid35284/ scgid28035/ Mitochondrial dicarboxylate carrier; Solute carrier family 25 member 10